MKVYAKQVDPKYQESPIFIDDDFFPDNIAVFGNRDYREHIPEVVENVRNVLENGELGEVLEYPNKWVDWYKNATEAINDYLPSASGKRYSTNAIHALRNLIIDYSCCSCSCEDEILCKVLSIVTNKKWDYYTIQGSCQSDWQNVFYTVEEWSLEALQGFERLYFNEGTEWIIDDGDFNPETDSPLNITGCSVYCTSWDKDSIKQEIANYEGIDSESVVLYAFDGYNHIPQYKEV